MLGLPYPGGPSIQRAAEGGNPKAYDFPRSLLRDDERLDFSFSGLKTAVRYTIAGPGKPDMSEIKLSPQQVADLAASFQEAVVDCLVGKAFLALRKDRLAHALLRRRRGGERPFARAIDRGSRTSKRPAAHRPAALCTDNAVMGAIAVERLKGGPRRKPRSRRFSGSGEKIGYL